MSESRSEWTPMAEAISFISATLGDTFIAAQGNGLYWGTLADTRPDGTRGYPVAVENLGSEIKVIVSFEDVAGSHADTLKLFAIVGWAAVKGFECEH